MYSYTVTPNYLIFLSHLPAVLNGQSSPRFPDAAPPKCEAAREERGKEKRKRAQKQKPNRPSVRPLPFHSFAQQKFSPLWLQPLDSGGGGRSNGRVDSKTPFSLFLFPPFTPIP